MKATASSRPSRAVLRAISMAGMSRTLIDTLSGCSLERRATLTSIGSMLVLISTMSVSWSSSSSLGMAMSWVPLVMPAGIVRS